MESKEHFRLSLIGVERAPQMSTQRDGRIGAAGLAKAIARASPSWRYVSIGQDG